MIAKKTWLSALVLSGTLLALHAQAVLTRPPGNLFVNFQSNDPNSVMMFVLYILLTISGTVGVLFLILGGFFYVTSGSNEDLAKRGKKYIQNAIIGLIIIILSYSIVTVIYWELFYG
jgi:hypothetical protein